MPTTVASMVLVLTDMAVDSMATVDTLPTHPPTATDTQLLTAMDLTGSTSVRLMLSQKPMLTTAASMVLVLTDMAVDSMATVDTLLTHTPTATDTQLLTATDLTGSTSVRPMLSQRLMLTTAVLTDTDTGHTLPHTPMDTVAHTLTDTTIKLPTTV